MHTIKQVVEWYIIATCKVKTYSDKRGGEREREFPKAGLRIMLNMMHH